MRLYYHPLSIFSQKVVAGFYEKGVPFTAEIVDVAHPTAKAAFFARAPLGRIPLLALDDGTTMPESSIILEWLDDAYPHMGPRLVPEDRALARDVRLRDRMIDLYLASPATKLLYERRRKDGPPDASGIDEALASIDRMYTLLEGDLVGRPWLVGDTFTMADCAAAAALGALRALRPFSAFGHLDGYFQRLLERPAIARVLKEGEPATLVLGAADRS